MLRSCRCRFGRRDSKWRCDPLVTCRPCAIAPHTQLGWAALHKAAENEDVEMIEYLLANGANINVVNKVGPVLVTDLCVL
jgi:hypothetical protein